MAVEGKEKKKKGKKERKEPPWTFTPKRAFFDFRWIVFSCLFVSLIVGHRNKNKLCNFH